MGFAQLELLAAQPWGAAPRGLWQRGGSVLVRGHTAVFVTAVPSVTAPMKFTSPAAINPPGQAGIELGIEALRPRVCAGGIFHRASAVGRVLHPLCSSKRTQGADPGCE